MRLTPKSFAFVWTCIICSPAIAQTTVNLTLNEARQAAVHLLLDGQAGAAFQLAEGLLQANPNDRDALIVKSAAARALGDPSLARRVGVQAFRVSQDGPEKYQAARLIAQAATAEERYTWAQYWLRIARQHAPNDAEAEAVARDYQVLRQLNPWSSNISFGLAPSGNINGGSQGTTGYLEGNVDPGFAAFLASFGIYDPETGLRLLGDNERALSGYEANFGIGSQYRLSQTESSATFLSGQLNINRYWLSDEAREQSPTSENSDFDRDSISIGLSHIRVLADGQRPATFSLGYGRDWYGGAPNSRYITASFSQPYLLSERDLLTFGLNTSVSASFNDDIPIRSYGVSTRLLHILENGDRIGGSIRLTKNVSEILDSNSNAAELGASYSFANPIYGLGVQLNATVTLTDIGETRFAPFDREDLTFRAGADVSIPAAEIFGFQPVLEFTAEQNRSTVDQFDRTAFGVGLNFQSSF